MRIKLTRNELARWCNAHCVELARYPHDTLTASGYVMVLSRNTGMECIFGNDSSFTMPTLNRHDHSNLSDRVLRLTTDVFVDRVQRWLKAQKEG